MMYSIKAAPVVNALLEHYPDNLDPLYRGEVEMYDALVKLDSKVLNDIVNAEVDDVEKAWRTAEVVAEWPHDEKHLYQVILCDRPIHHYTAKAFTYYAAAIAYLRITPTVELYQDLLKNITVLAKRCSSNKKELARVEKLHADNMPLTPVEKLELAMLCSSLGMVSGKFSELTDINGPDFKLKVMEKIDAEVSLSYFNATEKSRAYTNAVIEEFGSIDVFNRLKVLLARNDIYVFDKYVETWRKTADECESLVKLAQNTVRNLLDINV